MPNSSQSLWLIPFLRGLLAVVFGILLLTYPGLSLVFMIALFGAFVLVSGIFTVILAIKNRHIQQLWRNNLVDGIISIVIGLVVWLWPALTSILLVYLIAAWAVLSGLIQIISAIRLHSIFNNTWLSGVIGALLLILGIALFVHPGAGAMAIAVIIGIAAIVYGIAALGFGWQLRKMSHPH
jgi:uncharacterized membrane protein HdeD (DUF308 family)